MIPDITFKMAYVASLNYLDVLPNITVKSKI